MTAFKMSTRKPCRVWARSGFVNSVADFDAGATLPGGAGGGAAKLGFTDWASAGVPATNKRKMAHFAMLARARMTPLGWLDNQCIFAVLAAGE